MSALMSREHLLLDGGLGTTLEDNYGVKFSQHTPLWSSDLLISDPETLQKVQESFAEAGADIILTPTYQASHAGFRKTNPGISNDEIVRYLKKAVNISRLALNGKGLVALSLGAYGATLQPSQEYSGEYGNINEDALVVFHRERFLAFDLTKVDLVAFETLPRLDEIRAVKEVVHRSKPYWISCVFPNDNLLPDGSTIEEVLAAMMVDPKPWAVGMNCTKIHRVAELVKEFERAARELFIKLPRLVLYPDGTNGQVYDTSKQEWIGEEDSDGTWHEKMYEIGKQIVGRGAWEGLISGGCCKTSPRHIKGLHTLWTTGQLDI